ncbi:MAG TPA: cation:proton antiporter [Longimicrobium sp.]
MIVSPLPAASLGVEDLLRIVLIQVAIIMVTARVFGTAFRKIGQPIVCGEIAAGLILGPSLFGGLFPDLFRQVFDPAVEPIMGVTARLGLVLLLFLIGLDFDFGHLRTHSRAPLLISAGGVIFPFALGIGVAALMYPHVGNGVNRTAFLLFMATAMCITALPILGRIMIEYGLNRTRIGAITITAAAIDDAVGWTLLALVTSIVRSKADPVATTLMILQTLAFGAFMVFALRPLAHRWATRTLAKSGGVLSLNALAITLTVVFMAGVVTHEIGIFAIFGAFLCGAIMYDHAPFRDAVLHKLNDFVTVFFLPIFFTYTGLRTDMGSVQGGLLWGFCGLVLLAAVAGKFGGGALAARLSGFSWRESMGVGTMMNTRALMELIVINVGYDLGIIPRSVFFMLVFMAVATTYMTTPLLHLFGIIGKKAAPRVPAVPVPAVVRGVAEPVA